MERMKILTIKCREGQCISQEGLPVTEWLLGRDDWNASAEIGETLRKVGRIYYVDGLEPIIGESRRSSVRSDHF